MLPVTIRRLLQRSFTAESAPPWAWISCPHRRLLRRNGRPKAKLSRFQANGLEKLPSGGHDLNRDDQISPARGWERRFLREPPFRVLDLLHEFLRCLPEQPDGYMLYSLR